MGRLFEIDDGQGNILPQAEVAARRRTWVFMERGANRPIWGYMTESKLSVDQHVE